MLVNIKLILSRTVFQLSHSICQIIAFDKMVPLDNAMDRRTFHGQLLKNTGWT